MTVAAQLATVPVMAGTFGVVALGGPIANALVLPLLPAMIVMGGAGAILSALHPGLGLGAAPDRPSVGTVGDRRRARGQRDSRRGHHSRQLAGGLVHRRSRAAVIAGAHRPRRASHAPAPGSSRMNLRAIAAAAWRRSSLPAAAWALASRPDGRLHVTVLNTGSSTAVLVRTADGSTVLVDGGSSPTALLAALGRVMPPGDEPPRHGGAHRR